MGGTKIRGKSAINPANIDGNGVVAASHQNQSNNLLKIESVVPTITTRANGSATGPKFMRRSNSTLSPSYNRARNSGFNQNVNKHNGAASALNDVIEESQESLVFQNGGNLKVRRTVAEKEKLPDRINLDRRGLTSIPFIDDEANLRLLSLQHNLINVFQISIEKLGNVAGGTPPGGGITEDPKRTTALKKGSQIGQGRNVLAAAENKIQLGINSMALSGHHYQKNLLLKRSNSFINGPITAYQQTSATQSKAKLQHMMSFSSDNLLCMTNAGNAGNVANAGGPNKITNLTFPTAPPYTWPGFSISLQNLVFLDLYDNQIDRISNLDGLRSLTVLLLGKNRIVDITGITSLKSTLRVLDLHGNRISNISQKICQLQELKSLNLAGNLLRQISSNDFAGMFALKELNLKRNRIKKIQGFDDLRNLERLWLCHNDLQKIDDMSCIAKAVNLKEVTIENNPISLGGDCISFLVSYLPSLVLLSQMQVTEQVKRAANAWRRNKEISDSNFSNLSSDVCQNIRREEVISNARTSWELLRSQQIKPTADPRKMNDEVMSNFSDNVLTKKMTRQRTMINLTAKDKKVVQQSFSQDVPPSTGEEDSPVKEPAKEGDLNNNTNLPNQDEFFRLPPILAPFLEKTFSSDKMNSQGSSLGPNVDSESSYYGSDNDEVKPTKNLPKDEKVDDEKRPVTPSPAPKPITPPTNDKTSEKVTSNSAKTNSDSSSVITNSSDEHSTQNYAIPIIPAPRAPPKIRSATANRKYMSGSLVRAQTARGSCLNINANISNASSNVAQSDRCTSTTNSSISISNLTNSGIKKPAAPPTDREREQGGDYLIEICGRYLNVYGLGAIKFIDKQWNVQKANDVHTVKFSYINFNNIAVILYRIKVRFPNAENFVFRETNITCIGQLNALSEIQGINSLIIDPEGNPICAKEWRSYAIYRLSHWGLKQVNTIDITDLEIQAAEQTYIGLSDLVVWSLPDSLLQPLLTRLRLEENCQASKMSAKEWLMKADPSLKCVVGKEALQWKKTNSVQEEINFRQKGKNHLTSMMENTCNAVEKLQKLEIMWTGMLVEMIRNTLLDYSQIDVYVKNLMEEIMK